MGDFCHLLHLGPRQVEQLTVAEFEALHDYVTRMAKAMQKAGG